MGSGGVCGGVMGPGMDAQGLSARLVAPWVLSVRYRQTSPCAHLSDFRVAIFGVIPSPWLFSSLFSSRGYFVNRESLFLSLFYISASLFSRRGYFRGYCLRRGYFSAWLFSKACKNTMEPL